MIKVEASGLQAQLLALSELERNQLPYATALALTETAKCVKERLEGEMRTVFDRPTRYTLDSLRLFPATKAKLQARVWMKNEADKAAPASKWLTPEIYGGARPDKRTESLLHARGILPGGMYVVPGAGMKLDGFGNVNRGQLQRIISGLGAQGDRYQNSTDSKRSQANKARYFVMHRGRSPIGIAERTGKGRGGVSMLLAFVGKPGYHKALDFFAIAEREADDQLPAQFELAMARALATRRR
ncbi:MAG: hypothetical protein Q8R10_19515 [Pseudomonas sp.]|nr:hypothetical protein [Pseudomonas sp.]MDP3848613.1 hypothetical protein [Pseudomonas sp.]